MSKDARLELPTVTLVAATSVNLDATLAAMRRCMTQARFARVLLFTHDIGFRTGDGIEPIMIDRIGSTDEYSRFMLRDLADHIETSHCLVVQWDGFILDRQCWTDAFLDCDYIGAPWPQFADGHAVGNGGFSLRSKALLDACTDPAFELRDEAEDIAICRTNRTMLETGHGIRFADPDTAHRFSRERSGRRPSFGFHGIFNMIDAIGAQAFWEVYTGLDKANAVPADLRRIAFRLLTGPDGVRRAVRVLWDSLN